MSISKLKTTSGMKASLVQTYTFADVSWYVPTHHNYFKWSYLTTLCVQVGVAYYVRDKTVGWRRFESKEQTIRTMIQQHAGIGDPAAGIQTVTNEDITTFISFGLVTFDAVIYAPAMGDFLMYAGQKRLNTWKDYRLEGDDDFLPNTEEFLQMVRNSLCSEPDVLPLIEMMDEIGSNRPTPFRWIMHWLAARYQLPGYTTQTNLWFVGAQRGAGKGTVMAAMRGLIGANNVGKVSKEDMGRGFSSTLYAKELNEWDEFKSDKGWRDFGNTIKEKTGNDTITVVLKGKDAFSAPAVAMHVFSTNEERPIQVEETDRQNTFIQTTNDPEVALRSTRLWNERTNEFKDPNLLLGLAALLNEIAIDLAFIRRPLRTAKQDELREMSEDSIVVWMNEATKFKRAFAEWENLHDEYKGWVLAHMHVKPEDLATFKRKIVKAGYAKSDSRKVNGDSKRVAVILKKDGNLTTHPTLPGATDQPDNVIRL